MLVVGAIYWCGGRLGMELDRTESYYCYPLAEAVRAAAFVGLLSTDSRFSLLSLGT